MPRGTMSKRKLFLNSYVYCDTLYTRWYLFCLSDKVPGAAEASEEKALMLVNVNNTEDKVNQRIMIFF